MSFFTSHPISQAISAAVVIYGLPTCNTKTRMH